VTLWVLAQTGEPTSFLPSFLTQGVLGLVLVALLLGQLVTKPSVEQERRLHQEALARMNARVDEANARAEHAEQQRDELMRRLNDALPAMRDAAEQSKRMMLVVEDAISRFEREQQRRGSRDGPHEPRN